MDKMTKNLSTFNNHIKHKYQNINDALGILDQLERETFNKYLLYHQSYDDNRLGRAASWKRKAVYTLHWILSFILMVYMSILLKYNDQHSLRALGIVILMESEVKRITILIIFLTSSIFCLAKSLHFYFEMKKILHSLDLFRSFSNRMDFQLNRAKAEKLSMHINLCFRWVSSDLTKSEMFETLQ